MYPVVQRGSLYEQARVEPGCSINFWLDGVAIYLEASLIDGGFPNTFFGAFKVPWFPAFLVHWAWFFPGKFHGFLQGLKDGFGLGAWKAFGLLED